MPVDTVNLIEKELQTAIPFVSGTQPSAKHLLREMLDFSGVKESDLQFPVAVMHPALLGTLLLAIPLVAYRNIIEAPGPIAHVNTLVLFLMVVALVWSLGWSSVNRLKVIATTLLVTSIGILLRNDISLMATGFLSLTAAVLAGASYGGRGALIFQLLYFLGLTASAEIRPESKESYALAGAVAWLFCTNALIAMSSLIYASFDRQRTHLMELARRQSSMVSVIGHELRTPASALRMLGEAIASPDYVKRDMVASCDHLLEIIDDLRIAVSPAEDIKIRPRYIKLEDLARLLNAELTPLFNRGSVQLEIESVDDAKALLFIDANRLATVISNLVRNALKHSGGTRVTIRLHTSLVNNNRMRLTCSVTDDGAGLDVLDAPRLFKLFERGNTAAPGAGVGLYIVKKWTERLGGTVSYRRATQAGGSTFEVSLQQDFSEDERIGSTHNAMRSEDVITLKPGLSILLVEDDQLLRRLIQSTLQQQLGATVTQAADGQEALDLLAKHEYQLVISDYIMPRVDGLELLSEMKNRGDRTPVVALTAASIGPEMERLSAAGADGVLAKPLKLAELTEIVQRLIQEGRISDKEG